MTKRPNNLFVYDDDDDTALYLTISHTQSRLCDATM